MPRRTALALLSTLAIVLGAAAAPVAARGPNFPDRIDLPDGFQPEGITAGRGTTLFAGSLADGSVVRVDARTGRVSELVDGVTGSVAVGVDYERRADRLWVAGGPTGEVRVYDATSGALLETYTFPGSGFLNDLVVTRTGVYVTDSFVQRLAVIPLGANGTLPDPGDALTRPLSGDLSYVPNQFNANGIVAAGRWLILVQTGTGQLFRVDPATGATRAIDLGGASASFGDGLELRGRTLYVVRNQLEQVAVFRLRGQLTSARLIGTITEDDPGDLDFPTTAAVQAGRLWAVNARFTTPPAPTTAYWITQLPARP